MVRRQIGQTARKKIAACSSVPAAGNFLSMLNFQRSSPSPRSGGGGEACPEEKSPDVFGNKGLVL